MRTFTPTVRSSATTRPSKRNNVVVNTGVAHGQPTILTMGSDNNKPAHGGSSSRQCHRHCHRTYPVVCRRRRLKLKCVRIQVPAASATAAAAAAALLYLSNKYFFPPPELLYFDSFVPAADNNNATTTVHDDHLMPHQCRATASRVYKCQEIANNTLILGCHRRWCNSFGHCDACAGIGDRFYNFAMRHIHHAMSGMGDYPHVLEEKNVLINNDVGGGNNNDQNNGTICNIRIELDYPAPGISILRSAIYVDPGRWIAEAFRYRSYPTLKKDRPPAIISSSPTDSITAVAHFNCGKMDWRSRQTHQPVAFDHNWDPCLFHAFFQPNSQMRRELNFHQSQIWEGAGGRAEDRATTIAMHFRTGDALAFHDLDIPNDVRLEKGKTVRMGWEQMKECAQELARTSSAFAGKDRVRYVLATDNVEIKRMAREETAMDIYMTEVRPSNFRQNPGRDSDAWMELFLLSQQDGLVMNALADKKSYKGKADSISAFAKLVEKIGFYRKDQVKVCKL